MSPVKQNDELQSNTGWIVEEYIKKFEEESQKYNNVYDTCIKNMKKANLGKITENDKKAIEKYLYKWGGMARVLGRDKYNGWVAFVAKIIQKNSNKLDKFRQMQLDKVNLTSYKADIEELYEEFKKPVGRIAAAKILHIIAPGFFPPWDTAIAKVVRKTYNKNVETFSGEDYYLFTEAIQKFMKRYASQISYMANKHGRSKVKIVDEFLWLATHNPVYLFFP